MTEKPEDRVHAGRLRIPRSRGAASGFLIILLGLWGALVPFVGPMFDFAYDTGQGSSWSAARGWLEVVPGVVAVIGGLILLRSRNRLAAMLGGWLGVVAGAWFVVGRVVATTLTIGEIGGPVAETDVKVAWLELTHFYGLGAVIVFLAAIALGRLSVRSERDVSYAQRSAAARRDRVDEFDGSTAGTDPMTGATPVQRDTSRGRRSWRNPLARHPDEPSSASEPRSA